VSQESQKLLGYIPAHWDSTNSTSLKIGEVPQKQLLQGLKYSKNSKEIFLFR
jgi:hypothetical protein